MKRFIIIVVIILMCSSCVSDRPNDNSNPTEVVIYDGKSTIFEDALRYYETAILLNPDDAATYYNLGVIYDEHLDNPSRAIACYNKYLELSPDASDREKVKKWINGLQKRFEKMNWGQTVCGLKCRIASDKETYTIGEPIKIFIEIKNITNDKKIIWNHTLATGWRVNGHDCQASYGLPVQKPLKEESQVILPHEVFKTEYFITDLSVPVSPRMGKVVFSEAKEYYIWKKLQLAQLNEKDEWESLPILISTGITIKLIGKQPDLSKLPEVSKRWKSEHKIEDFCWLKDNYIKIGDTADCVKLILGEPVNITGHRWLYVKCDIEKKQYSAWYLLLDLTNKVSGWYEKPIE